MASTDLSLQALLSRAQIYCARGERCVSQVGAKLLQWGAEEDDVDGLIEQLKKEKYIDEERFCRAYAHDKVQYQGWGKYKIKMMLRGLGLSGGDIESGLNSIDENEYFRMMNKVAASKKGVSKEQLARFLMQRGYSYDDICRRS